MAPWGREGNGSLGFWGWLRAVGVLGRAAAEPTLQPAAAHLMENLINIRVKSIYTQSLHRESHRGDSVL